MKIRLLRAAPYEGLAAVEFPVEVEVEREGYSLYYVAYDTIAALPGWFFHKYDTYEGGPYCFYNDEVEVVDNSSHLFGEKGCRQAVATEEPSTTEELELAPTDKDRKAILLQLILDYGITINDGCYEMEYGTMQSYEEYQAEEDRLFQEIAKMVEEGV